MSSQPSSVSGLTLQRPASTGTASLAAPSTPREEQLAQEVDGLRRELALLRASSAAATSTSSASSSSPSPAVSARGNPHPHALPGGVQVPGHSPLPQDTKWGQHSADAPIVETPSPYPSTSGAAASSGAEDTMAAAAAAAAAACAVARPALTIVVIGASGDLAKKKTFPALFSLWAKKLLPADVVVVGYARSQLGDDEYKTAISSKFPKTASPELKAAFLQRCSYVHGAYDSPEDFTRLTTILRQKEAEATGCQDAASADNAAADTATRIFYLAIPPNLFVDVCTQIDQCARPAAGKIRVIVEKPFGRDLESALALGNRLSQCLTEKETFRIDHYLGKEMVQNIVILRFANRVFEPLWSAQHVNSVTITFKEDFGTQGRGGYFDHYGIIRDVMQNHLLQILSLVAMEPPVTLGAEDVRDEKVKLLRAIRPITLDDVVVGQYGSDPSGKEPAYLDDPLVPKDSLTPTFATAVLHIRNSRWHGTPFILKCGKALNERKAEVRVQFKRSNNGLFPDLPPNELVVRVQPNDSVYLKMITKEPGLVGGIKESELDFTVASRFPEHAKDVSDAYERLIWDVSRDDHNLFVRADELTESWKIFTPVLQELEANQVRPILYQYGSRGPPESDALIKKYGFVTSSTYRWKPPERAAASSPSSSSSTSSSSSSSSSSSASSTSTAPAPAAL